VDVILWFLPSEPKVFRVQAETRGIPTGRVKLMGVCIAVGIAMGAAIGAATHNMGEWVAIGAAIGVVIGVITSRKKRNSY
jgi:hypothetical protein